MKFDESTHFISQRDCYESAASSIITVKTTLFLEMAMYNVVLVV